VILLLPAALAAGSHTGIPTTGVEGLAAPMYQTSQTGWTALVEDGLIRVFVGQDDSSATTWVETLTGQLAKLDPQPYPDLADMALGDGETLLLIRDGNIGILVHTKANALHWAEQMLGAISDEPVPWPAPPTLLRDELGWWRLQAPGAVHIAYVGGERLDEGGLVFSSPPRAAVAWDGWGRAARVEFDRAASQ
jgi:hypothetical protein